MHRKGIFIFFFTLLVERPTYKSLGKHLKNPSHPDSLHPNAQKALFSIYKDLSKHELFQGCWGGHTQNANESFNSTIWRWAPKHPHSGLIIVQVTTYLVAAMFNEEQSINRMTIKNFGIVVGRQSFDFAHGMDEQRVNRQNRRRASETKEAKKLVKELQAANQMCEEEEGGTDV